MRWFGVKTFVRTCPTGRPRKRDAHYRDGLAIVEEIVMLLEAKNSDSAIKKARTEVKRFCAEIAPLNLYGQKLVRTLLSYAEAFPMFEPPGHGASVFGSSEVVCAAESPSQIVRRKIGTRPARSGMRVFLPAEIAEQLGYKLQRK
jgi:hypothetical protein